MPNDTDPPQNIENESTDNDNDNDTSGGSVQEQQPNDKNKENNDYKTRIAPWESLLIGKKLVGARTRSQAHQDSENLVSHSELPKTWRLIKPGNGYTQDYNKERLNVFVDKEGTVFNVSLQ